MNRKPTLVSRPSNGDQRPGNVAAFDNGRRQRRGSVFCYAPSDAVIADFAGNVTVASGAEVSGDGAVVVIDNLTVDTGATLNIQTPSSLALGCGGKLLIDE